MKIGVLGYGKMGAAIAGLLQNQGYDLTVVECDTAKMARGERRFTKRLKRNYKRGDISESEFQKRKQALVFTEDIGALAQTDLVIESIIEDVSVKREIFHNIEKIVPDTTILTSNTSSVSIEAIAGELNRPERFCGFHFFYPVPLIDMVEVIRHSGTSDTVVERLRHMGDRIGKPAAVVADAPGSVINAILAYYYVEALYILEEGRMLPSRIDQLARKFFYVGPCESIDIIGVDFLRKALEIAATPGSLSPIRWDDPDQAELTKAETGGREGFYVPFLFRKLVDEKRIGKAAGKGVFLYDNGRPVDDDIRFYINPNRSADSQADTATDEIVAKRLLYAIYNGAIYSLNRKMAAMEDLDLGLKQVLQASQGPFASMNASGKHNVKNDFTFLAEKIGIRFRQEHFAFLTT